LRLGVSIISLRPFRLRGNFFCGGWNSFARRADRAGFSNSLWRKQLRRRFGPTPFRPAAGAATKRNLQLLARQTLAAQNAPPTLTPVDMR
jgi:hypothetical protein